MGKDQSVIGPKERLEIAREQGYPRECQGEEFNRLKSADNKTIRFIDTDLNELTVSVFPNEYSGMLWMKNLDNMGPQGNGDGFVLNLTQLRQLRDMLDKVFN